MAPKPPSFIEKLLLLPNVARLVLAVIFRLLSRPFIRGAKQKGVLKDALYAGLRTNLTVSSVTQEQYLLGTTEGTYKQIAVRNRSRPDTQVLPSGVKIHWIGSRTAKKVILYFHGGGYVLPCSQGHWQFLFDMQKGLARRHNISIAALAYTLAPEVQYPGQLKQAVEALAFLFEKQKRTPGQIFIGGDSAGGNLTLAVLSHLLHPHPQVQDLRSHLTEPFPGAVLISPWAQFLPHGGSADTNIESDLVTPVAAHRWSQAYQGSSPTDNYLEPALAEETWFEGIDSIVKEIIVWGGGAELLVDCIVRMAKLLTAVHPKTETVIQPGSGHEDFIMTRLLHIKEKDDHAKLITSWIDRRA